MPPPPPSHEPERHSWEERNSFQTQYGSVSHRKDGCFEEARQGDKFDKELMKTGIILINSLGLLGQVGEGQISAS